MKQKAAHTRGPWYALDLRVEGKFKNISIRHKTGDVAHPLVAVASVDGRYPDDCELGSSSANACLIAAAPDLIEALRAVVATEMFLPDHPQRQAAYRNARAAITKATGEAA